MDSVHGVTPCRPAALDAASEVLELADVGARDPGPEMDEAFGYGTGMDELTEREIEALYVARMEARDGENDPDPGRRRGGAGYADALRQYADDDLIDAIARAAERLDDGRWVGVDASNPEHPDEAHPTIPGFLLKDRHHKEQFLAAATSELLRRADARTPAAAAPAA